MREERRGERRNQGQGVEGPEQEEGLREEKEEDTCPLSWRGLSLLLGRALSRIPLSSSAGSRPAVSVCTTVTLTKTPKFNWKVTFIFHFNPL